MAAAHRSMSAPVAMVAVAPAAQPHSGDSLAEEAIDHQGQRSPGDAVCAHGELASDGAAHASGVPVAGRFGTIGPGSSRVAGRRS